jgi:sugar lactone lactonase YvrE
LVQIYNAPATNRFYNGTILDGKVKKIYERLEQGQKRLMTGPETIVFGNDGTMYSLTEEGFLVSLSEFEEKDDGVTITAKSKVVADLGMGRPLGGRFDAQDTLYLADAHLGLTRLKSPGSGSKVELVASRVFDEGKWTQIMYANDVAIGPTTGLVYFTDCK